nr:ATP-binding cassette domain-containing protein [Anaerolineae bacterium]
ALSRWAGALLIVSHDRAFLDRTVNTIWALSRVGIVPYRGNYSAYVRQRDHNAEYAEKVYESEMARMTHELDYIKRFITHDKLRTLAIGRLRRLSRDLMAIQQLGLMAYHQCKSWSEAGIGRIRPYGVAEAEAALESLPKPNTAPPRLLLRLKSGGRTGEYVLRAHGLQVGYAGHPPLVSVDELVLMRGQVAALIGPNGAGKTTLLRTLLGQVPALSGTVRLGSNVKVGYFAQAHEQADPNATVVDALMEAARLMKQPLGLGEARRTLALYQFRGDDVFKTVSGLSGGERGRLALAMLALQGANLLLLDEPTNHLDIQAQESLEQVLADFDGTILLVSHDRYLVERLATHLWRVEGGRIVVSEQQPSLQQQAG